MKNKDKYIGCLLGGAVGDALGYGVEFDHIDDIIKTYGDKGISEYKLTNNIARISDDTQMSLFTATGLLVAATRGINSGGMTSLKFFIGQSYRDWYLTQTREYPLKGDEHYSFLVNIEEMFSDRHPGRTCLQALGSGGVGTIERPINNSKGCGGVMRVSPVGMFFSNQQIPKETIDIIGADTSALTHGHELGYIPSAALVHIITTLLEDEEISLIEAVEDSIKTTKQIFKNTNHIDYFVELMEKAIELSKEDIDDKEGILQLGEGWVAEETLAIALYSALKYENDFEKAIIASVNHSGDSDSTGAVTGNIMGAYLGKAGIPEKFLNNLEFKDLIEEIAIDLYKGSEIHTNPLILDKIWEEKYVYMTYKK